MFNGRYFHCDKLQFRCGLGAAAFTWHNDVVGTSHATASCAVWLQNDKFSGSPQSGLAMAISTDKETWDDWLTGGGTISEGTTVDLTFLGTIFPTHTISSFSPGEECYVEFTGYRLWMLGTALWEVSWTSVNWYRGDGSLIASVDGARTLHSDGPVAASLVPMFMGAVWGTCNAGVGFSSTDNYFTKVNGTQEYTATMEFKMGWRYSTDGGTTWQTGAVKWLDSNIGTNGTSWEPGLTIYNQNKLEYKSVGTSSTAHNGAGHPYILMAQYETGKFTTVSELVMIPNGPHENARIYDDHEAPVFCCPMDQAVVTTIQTTLTVPHHRPIGPDPDPDTGTTTTTTTTIYEAVGAQAHLFGNTASSIESQILGDTAPSASNISFVNTERNSDGCVCYADPDNEFGGYTNPLGSTYIPATGPDVGVGRLTATKTTTATAGPLFDTSHSSVLPVFASNAWPTRLGQLFQYVNTRCNPGWSLGFAFQDDHTHGITGPMHLQGDVEGWWRYDPETETWNPSYWAQIKTTYNMDVIPAGERTTHRAIQVMTPFVERGLGGLLDDPQGAGGEWPATLLGYRHTWWWGLTNAKFIVPGPDGQVRSVSAGTHCASRWLAFKADDSPETITVADDKITIGKDARNVLFSLLWVPSYPYGWFGIANQIQIPALPSDSNIASYRIELVSEEGTLGLIATSEGTYNLGPFASNGWSLSDAIQYGDPDIIDDTYQPVAAGDTSPEVYGSEAHLLSSTAKTRAFSGTAIKLTPVPIDDTQPMKFPTPTFLCPDAADMVLLPLTSRDSALLVPNGPSLLIGPQIFWDPTNPEAGYDNLLPSPEVQNIDANGQMSAGDIAMFFLSVFTPSTTQTPIEQFTPFMSNYFVQGTTGTVEWILPHHFWRDGSSETGSQYSTGFSVGPRPAFVMLNSFSSLPPLSLMGQQGIRLSENNWAPTTPLKQRGYTCAFTKFHMIVPWNGTEDKPQLTDGSDTNLLSDGVTVSGWYNGVFLILNSNDGLYTLNVRAAAP